MCESEIVGWKRRGLICRRLKPLIGGEGKMRSSKRVHSPVHVTTRRVGTGIATLLALGGDDRFQILALPPLLLSISVGSRRSASDLLCFVDGSFLNVCRAIHH